MIVFLVNNSPNVFHCYYYSVVASINYNNPSVYQIDLHYLHTYISPRGSILMFVLVSSVYICVCMCVCVFFFEFMSMSFCSILFVLIYYYIYFIWSMKICAIVRRFDIIFHFFWLIWLANVYLKCKMFVCMFNVCFVMCFFL